MYYTYRGISFVFVDAEAESKVRPLNKFSVKAICDTNLRISSIVVSDTFAKSIKDPWVFPDICSGH